MIRLLFCCLLFSLPLAIPAEEVCEVFGPGDKPDDAALSLLRQDKSVVRRQPKRELQFIPGEKEGFLLQLPEGKEAASYEYLFHSARALPEFLRAELTLSVLLPAGSGGKELSALLVDQEGEIFSIPASLPPGDGAWHDVVFSVDANTLDKMSRGGKAANRKVDPPLRFAGLAGDSRSIGLGVMRCRVLDSNAPLALELLTGSGSDIHVLKKGEEKSLELLLRNPRPLKPLSGVLKWSLFGVRGEPLAEKEEKVALEPDGEKRLPLPTPAIFGVYKLRVEVTDDDPSVRPCQKEMSFAYLIPAGPTKGRDDGFVFGIAGHPQEYNSAEQRKEAMAAGWCGAKALREDIYWYMLQPTRETWNFLSFDRVIKIFGEYGIEMMPIYSFCASWATAKEWKPVKPAINGHRRPDYDAWRKLVKTFAERYRDKVRYTEIWNEPDLYIFANFPETEYVRMLEIAYEEIKKTAPEWKVVNGGFSNILDRSSDIYNAAAIPAVVKSGKYDFFGFHGHSLFEEYRYKLQRLLACGNRKPWFMTETGLTSMVYGEETQARTLFQKLLYTWAKGAVGYNWYDLRNDGFDPANAEHNYGMLTHDFYPKPVYAAYNSLSNLYRGGKFLREVRLGSGLYGFLFQGRDGAQLLAAWSTAGEEVQPLLVSGITGRAETVDLYGNAQELPLKSGIATFKVGAEPVTLRVTGQNGEIKVAGALVRPVGKLKIDPGQEAAFTFELYNPEATERNFRVSLTLPEGLSADAKAQTVQIAPGKTKQVKFPVRAKEYFRSMPGRQEKVTLTFDRQKYSYRIDSATPVSAKGFRSAPDFVIDSAKQVRAWVAAAPHTAHLWWKGKQDLSAKVWLGRDGETLLVKAEVRDDQHVQPHSGSDVYKGDSIQIGLVVPWQKVWEIELARLESGRSEVRVGLAPKSFQAEAAAAKIALKTSRDERNKVTVYEARIPFEAVGLKESGGFQFNLLVNDNDGPERESSIAIAPGIPENDTSRYPVVKF